MWSLTRRGTVLNLHMAYREAPCDILDAFAAIARDGGIASPESRRAAEIVSRWPALAVAIDAARAAHGARVTRSGAPSHCCATPPQRRYLRSLYRYFNLTRFGGRLPEDVPVRLSSRMKSALGHMLPGEDVDGRRVAAEIALNVDLMLEDNGAERVDTLLHEMAHVADYLDSGHRGHGESWREWAKRVGCRPVTLYERPVAYRARRRDPVTRVPPLPVPLRFDKAGLSGVGCTGS